MKGQFVRSRLQWLQDGERPSKYLSGLENKNVIEKTLKNVNLFENRDDRLQEINLENLGIKSDIKVPEEDIGLSLTVEELGLVLKKNEVK